MNPIGASIPPQVFSHASEKRPTEERSDTKRGHESDSSGEPLPAKKNKTTHRPAIAKRLSDELARSHSPEKENAIDSAGSAEKVSTGSRANVAVTVRKAQLEDNDAVNEFTMNLDENSFNKRFLDMDEREWACDLVKTYTGEHDAIFLAFDGTKVVGMADCNGVAERCDPTLVCEVNMVVDGKFQGKQIGKELVETRDKHLQENGYRYKVGSVLRENQVHINRLLKMGWQETPTSLDAADEELREFWMAVDPHSPYKNIPPLPLPSDA